MFYYKKLFILLFTGGAFLLAGCSKEDQPEADFVAPDYLPPLTPGIPLNDSILKLYEETGIAVFTDPASPRFTGDLVSSDPLNYAGGRKAADTAAALFAIKMIREEFYNVLPEAKKNSAFRNFYLMKNPLYTGTGNSQVKYESFLWSNSTADVSIGFLNNSSLDTNQLKGAFFYALASGYRQAARNQPQYAAFMELMTNSGYYYWQVYTMEEAYTRGFVSNDQTKIKANTLDFDLLASWLVTTPPATRDSLLNKYSLLRQKCQIVSNIFRQEGIVLEDINEKWMMSPLRP